MVARSYPRLVIDLAKLEQNARTVCELARKVDIDIYGVTKAACGDPEVARAMLRGGVVGLADSRIENIRRMRDAGIESSFMLLRTPMLSDVGSVVEHADISLNSEMKVIRALSKAAERIGKKHSVVLMAEMGDLREGMTVGELWKAVVEVMELPGLELTGLGTNLACFGGVVPTEEKMHGFGLLVRRLEKEHSMEFDIVSGGNSANIPLLLSGADHGRTNNLRIGEGILLGLETVNRTPIPGTFQDAFMLEAELIEVKEKPSVPDGEISQNAFGETPVFEDRGKIIRGIAAIGRQDVIVEGPRPLDGNVSILGSSSDHVILHLEDPRYRVGSIVSFMPTYGALVAIFTSRYVGKMYM